MQSEETFQRPQDFTNLKQQNGNIKQALICSALFRNINRNYKVNIWRIFQGGFIFSKISVGFRFKVDVNYIFSSSNNLENSGSFSYPSIIASTILFISFMTASESTLIFAAISVFRSVNSFILSSSEPIFEQHMSRRSSAGSTWVVGATVVTVNISLAVPRLVS